MWDSEEQEPEISNVSAYEQSRLSLLGKVDSHFADKLRFPLYHYTRAASLCSILSNKELWFTKWNSLNDPTEFKLIHDIIDRHLQMYDKESEFYRMINTYNSVDRYSKRADVTKWYNEYNVFILSFSTKGDSLNMWSCYTKSSQDDGYAIAFSESAELRNDDYYIQWIPVIYEEEEQEKLIANLIRDLYDVYNDPELSIDGEHDRDLIISYLFDDIIRCVGCAIKHPAYKEEAEVRAILHLINKECIKHRTSGGLIVPYVSVKIDTSKIESVRISPALRYRDAISGLKSLRYDLNMHFKIEQSDIPYRNN